MNKNITLFAISLITIAIILGALGAHGLKNIISIEKLQSFETGVKYQMYQGLAFLVIGLNGSLKTNKLFIFSGIIGTILFSFSIYILCLSDFIPIPKIILVPLTPIGGFLMILSWITLFFSILKNKK